ncbi:MAG TPA: vitamin K epoxide reductase family protein, partial [Phycisphaerales bacterium]|nr:vitamin K epoxide reductase family protein [Phycisphaerales bacterium]
MSEGWLDVRSLPLQPGHGRHSEHQLLSHHDHSHQGGHAQMLRSWIWRDFANITLGLWLIASPSTLGLWHTSPLLAWSDTASGVAVVGLGVLTLLPRFDLARWGICTIGLWLLFAPLVFWTPSPGAYANDTLVGSLLIAFSVLVPMMPGRSHHEVMAAPGPDTPPGWSYNPSDWTQRGPIIAMAFVGFFLSRYLAAYQLKHTPYPWDPFFGDGTQRVLDSDISKAWPVSDAGLGAASYMIEALSGFMGGRNRWRTMPWMVVMFGVLVVPLGIVSIVLVVLQPVAVGAWCALCLVTAAAMLIMVSPAIDEVVAMGQFLAAARREGKPLWRTFWLGGTLSGYGAERDPPEESSRSSGARVFSALDLNNIPWNMALSAAIGIWLMAAPSILGATGRAADSGHV